MAFFFFIDKKRLMRGNVPVFQPDIVFIFDFWQLYRDHKGIDSSKDQASKLRVTGKKTEELVS